MDSNELKTGMIFAIKERYIPAKVEIMDARMILAKRHNKME